MKKKYREVFRDYVEKVMEFEMLCRKNPDDECLKNTIYDICSLVIKIDEIYKVDSSNFNRNSLFS